MILNTKNRHRHYYKLKKKGYKKMYRKVGFFRVMLDLILGFLTGGIWWLYLLIKFIRGNMK